MKKEEKQDHETIEEDYGDYVRYLDDTLPPAEETTEEERETNEKIQGPR